MIRLAFLICLLGAELSAETLVASRTVRAQTILSPADLTVIERSIPGMLQSVEEAVGLEARVALYAGRPIHPENVGPPAIVDRNQIVTLIYNQSGLMIATEARALGRAGVGDFLRVMNLASKSTVSGVVQANGTVRVGGPSLF